MSITQSYEKLMHAREEFFKYGHTDIPELRKEIVDSWIRSKNYGVNASEVDLPVLDSKHLQKLIHENWLLYQTALPIMEVLYNFVKGTDITISLTEKNGIVLKMLGDKKVLDTGKNQASKFMEGCNRSERAIGTNGIGTPLVTNKPLQLSGLEHYYKRHETWTCSGAPIMDTNGNAVAVFCISGFSKDMHKHTLGISIAAATAISNQLQLHGLYTHTLSIKNQLQMIMDMMDRGIILVGPDLKISHINDYALKMLNIGEENLLHKPISSIIHNIKFNELQEDIDNIETSITLGHKSQKIFIGVRCISPHLATHQQNPSFLLTLRDKKSVHKLVNAVIGSNAYFQFDDIIGSSVELERVKRLAKIAASNNSNVLLCGPSGTGKELFAQSIHNASNRSTKPFVAINCGALPRSLLESELFGYEGGAFTGAKKDGQSGKFELANGGTIFLDEIGDMPYEVQVSLLRVLQNREIIRIGATHATPIDVRIIAATNKNLEEAIAENRFREDLYYRLNVFNIVLPSLVERRDDIIELAYYFLGKYNQQSKPMKLDDNVSKLFMSYPWPGNIRELENVIERACFIAQDDTIGLDALPQNIVHYQKKASTARPVATQVAEGIALNNQMTVAETEKALIINHLVKEHGNIKRTSESLGMNRRTLYRKLEKYGIAYDKLRNE